MCIRDRLGAEELAAAKQKLGITGGAFEVAADTLKAWRGFGAAGAAAHKDWSERFATLSERKRGEFDRRLAHAVPAKLDKAILAHKKALIAAPQAVATRKASELALEAIIPVSYTHLDVYKRQVRDYLASRGIAADRMRTISYGKERPVAVCNDISCWSQNRRSVTVLDGAGGAPGV